MICGDGCLYYHFFIMQNLFQQVTELIKQDDRVFTTDGVLLRNKLQELIYGLDDKLISMLLSDKQIKEKFFKEVNWITLFDQKKFIQLINNKQFLPDSYTAYKNKIGLVNGDDEYISGSNEVVLNRPYKDCILAWCQDKEDAKRNEIFYNEILWSDQIDRLLDPKVFTNFKKYNTEWESELNAFTRDENGIIKDNLIVKGNNLLALQSLKKEFAGRVKLIYIDPPYNTGNDWFKYNDKFNHSSRLTFMKNRLEVARELLKDDGVIFVQIDNSPSWMKESPEIWYLLVLMDEVFKRKNYITSLIWKKKWNASNTEDSIGTITESVLMYSKNIDELSVNLQSLKRTYRFEWKFYNIEQPVKTNDWTYQRTTMLFGINTKEWIFYPPDGKRRTFWEDTANKIVSWNQYLIIENKFYIKKFPESYKKWEYKLHNNLLLEHGSLKSAKNELLELWFGREQFWSPKPETLIQRIIELSTQSWDIVLDYHLWSWTTCAVAHKMWRQYIGIEQMDYIETIAVERMKKVIEWEQGWISKAVDRKWWWDLVYMEIMKHNQILLEEISSSQTKEKLIQIYHTIKNSSFINYNVDISSIDKTITDFWELSLDDMKGFLRELIDKNTLYVNLTDINDLSYNVSDEDKKLNADFYK